MTHVRSPLRELWRRQRQFRGRLVVALAMSTINKIADVVPELLIGAVVDVVIRGDQSFVASLLGIESRFTQLAVLAAANGVVWIAESLSEYAAEVAWRGLAHGVEHELRVEAYSHVQQLDVGWHESRQQGATLATLNDDVNQLEQFLDTGAPRMLQLALNVILVGAVFAAASWQCSCSRSCPSP